MCNSARRIITVESPNAGELLVFSGVDDLVGLGF